MVTEITASLRDWRRLTNVMYLSNKERWRGIFKLMGELMSKRSKILSGALTLEELRDMRQIINTQIDLGNFLLRLDLTVRDTDGNIIDPDTASVVHIYRRHEVAAQRVKKSVAVGSSVFSDAWLNPPAKVESVVCHSHMFFVAVRNFVSRVGEDTELLLCLFDANQWKPLTESYLIRWSRQGLALDLDLLGNLKALFTDLSNMDLVRPKIFFVCYVVRLGQIEIRDDSKRGSSSTRRIVRFDIFLFKN